MRLGGISPPLALAVFVLAAYCRFVDLYFPEKVALFFRPLSSLSYSFNYALSGMNPFAFHLTDVLIHTAATLALYELMTTLGLRRWPAAISAATFATHPAMASLVPSLPRRHDSLAALGVFSALAIAVWLVRQPRSTRATRLLRGAAQRASAWLNWPRNQARWGWRSRRQHWSSRHSR